MILLQAEVFEVRMVCVCRMILFQKGIFDKNTK